MSVTNPHQWTDDDGTGLTGTAINNTALQNIYNDLGPFTSTITTTGTTTTLATPGALNSVIYCNNASLLTIQGIVAGNDGQLLTLISIGAGQVDLANQNVNATAANRLVNFATSAATSLAAGVGVIMYRYVGTSQRWVIISHDQGHWIDFSASSSLVGWSSTSIKLIYYKLVGSMLYAAWDIDGTSNSLSTSLSLPYGISTVRASGALGFVMDNGNNASTTPGQYDLSVGGGTIAMYKDNLRGNWTASGEKRVIGHLDCQPV